MQSLIDTNHLNTPDLFRQESFFPNELTKMQKKVTFCKLKERDKTPSGSVPLSGPTPKVNHYSILGGDTSSMGVLQEYIQ